MTRLHLDRKYHLAQQRNYQERIIVDPRILAGKPVIKGTRIPVELVLEHLASDPKIDTLFEAFPRLTLEDVKACLAYAQRLTAFSSQPPIYLSPNNHEHYHPSLVFSPWYTEHK